MKVSPLLTIGLRTAGISFCLATLLLGCDTQQQQSAQGSTARQAIMEINGQPIYADELLSSPYLRMGISDFVKATVGKSMLTEQGYEVSQDELDQILADQKKYFLETGTSWEAALRKQLLTEAEVLEGEAFNILFRKAVLDRTEIDETAVIEMWETRRDSLVGRYLRTNHLPKTDAEAARVSLEDVRGLIEEQLRGQLQVVAEIELGHEITIQCEVGVLAIDDPTKRAQLEDLIINYLKEDAKNELARAAAARGEVPSPEGMDQGGADSAVGSN